MADQVVRYSKAARVSIVLTDEGRFRVIAGDEVIAETKVASYAQIAFDEAVEELTVEIRKRRNAEAAQYEVNAVRESSVKKATSRRGSGGRGGRGGL